MSQVFPTRQQNSLNCFSSHFKLYKNHVRIIVILCNHRIENFYLTEYDKYIINQGRIQEIVRGESTQKKIDTGVIARKSMKLQ